MEGQQMEQDGFVVLERRVAEALATLQKLREEKTSWTLQRDELQSTLQALTARNGELESELNQVRESSIPRSEYEQRKARIEARVHQLLARFEQFDAAAAE